MKLENEYLTLELCNKGGEMASLTYKGYDVLYKGDGKYWGGKNPTLFPMISSPDAKKYTLDGISYPCRNHGLIRYMNLETICDDQNTVTMRLKANEETLKEYPFNFNYEITYRLDGKKVLIDYEITNNDTKIMPFTFGLHPGFIVRNFEDMVLSFPEDTEGCMIKENTGETRNVVLGEYKDFIPDVIKQQTIVIKDLKSKYVILKQKEYNVKVDMSNFKYLGLWTADPNAEYMCIEPWLSINNIKTCDNPFKDEFELVKLKPQETFKINYFIELD